MVRRKALFSQKILRCRRTYAFCFTNLRIDLTEILPGSVKPSAEALRKIARTFAISTDWLLFEEGERAPSDDLALQFEAVQQLSDDERAVIREIVESLIIKYQTRRWDSARPPAPAAKKASARRTSSASR